MVKFKEQFQGHTIAGATNQASWWRRPEIDQSIRNLVHQGVSPEIDWSHPAIAATLKRTKLINQRTTYSLCKTDWERAFCRNQLMEHVEQGYLKEVDPNQVKAYIPYFATKSSGKKWRLVCHPKEINEASLSPKAVIYEDLSCVQELICSMPQETLLWSIDITKAYYHILLAPWLRPLMGIRVDGRSFCWTVLFLGQNYAPLVFTLVTREIVRILRAMGIRVLRYLDDFIGMSPPEKAQREIVATAVCLAQG